MVVTQTANQPIAFGGQIVAYPSGTQDLYQEKEIVATSSNTPKTFTNAQGTVQYVQTGTSTNPQAYTTN